MKDNLQSLYNNSETIISQFYKINFLQTCYHHDIIPKGLKITKSAHSKRNDSIQKRWNGVLSDTEKILLTIMIEEEVQSMKVEEALFWEGTQMLQKL